MKNRAIAMPLCRITSRNVVIVYRAMLERERRSWLDATVGVLLCWL